MTFDCLRRSGPVHDDEDAEIGLCKQADPRLERCYAYDDLYTETIIL